LNDVTQSANVTEHQFRFPNTKITDRFNITVRAIGEGGIGNPLHTYPERWKSLAPLASQSNKTLDPLMIFAIIVISIVLVLLVVSLVLCKQIRYCKNNHNGIINSEQSSFSPASQCMENNMIRNDEMFEMQTLISASQHIIVNGKDNSIKSDAHTPSTNGNIMDMEKILRTSTPTEELTSGPQLKDDEKVSDERKPNGIKAFQATDNVIIAIPPPAPSKATLRSPLKVNGNLTPYKTLQVRGPFIFFCVTRIKMLKAGE
jgi:hypothetical protein